MDLNELQTCEWIDHVKMFSTTTDYILKISPEARKTHFILYFTY